MGDTTVNEFIKKIYLYKKYYRTMSSKELKDRITKVLDDIPEDVLVDVLEYLKSLTNKSGDTVRLTQHLRQIPDEDKQLLEQPAK